MGKDGVVHMPSSLGCRVSHSSVVTVETIASSKINSEYSLLVLYIGKEYFPFTDMWDIDHPGPPAMHKIILVHPGRSAGPTFPTVSWSDEGTIMTSLNSASSRELT